MTVTKKLIAIIACTAFIACSSNEEALENVNRTITTDQPQAIQFNNSSIFSTRAAGLEAANLLGKQFVVYGTKIANSSEASLTFPNYRVDYVGKTDSESNSSGWEYVFDAQTIRYWDLMASKYIFTAYANPGKQATVSNLTNDQCTVDVANANAMAGLYISDKTIYNKDKFGQTVILTFRNAATKVRFGIYEQITGYSVSDVVFRYDNNKKFSNDCILDGRFNAANGGQYTVSYDADNKPVFSTSATTDSQFRFGTFDCGSAMGTTRELPTWAGGSTDYINVFPNTDHAAGMTLCINFTLTSDDGKDIIRVKGAHVTVPAEQMIWKPNFAYTYLFKLTNNTNGTTGNDPDNPDPSDDDDPDKPKDVEGLIPITFDVIVVDLETGTTSVEYPIE